MNGLQLSGPLRVVEEVPGADRRWFVSYPYPIRQGEPEAIFGKDSQGSLKFPSFATQKEAEAWCKERGYEFVVERFDYEA